MIFVTSCHDQRLRRAAMAGGAFTYLEKYLGCLPRSSAPQLRGGRNVRARQKPRPYVLKQALS